MILAVWFAWCISNGQRKTSTHERASLTAKAQNTDSYAQLVFHGNQPLSNGHQFGTWVDVLHQSQLSVTTSGGLEASRHDARQQHANLQSCEATQPGFTHTHARYTLSDARRNNV